jgi:hypothetical protein
VLISNIQLFLFNSPSQYVASHTIFSLFAYMHRMVWMRVCKFSSFSMCMWALCKMLPTHQDWVSKTCKSWCETNYTKKGFCTLDFPCTSTWRWSHFAWAFTWVKQFPFRHLIIESHAHHFKCVNSFEGDIGNKAPPQKSKDNHIWLFLPQRCAPSWGVRWTTISKCMQWSTCQLCTPTSTPP